MLPRYYSGRTVTGLVSASDARTFGDVVESFRICPTIGMTREAFLALPKKERDEKKAVPFFVAACFNESPSRRVYEQATKCNLLFLDIDIGKDAAPFVSNPNSLYKALGELNFIAYLTANSTPEKPRMRIVIDASDIPLASYARAVLTIGAMLGLKVNTESKVAVQPMFLPVMFSDGQDSDHPLIAHRLDGRTFLFADLGDGLFPEFSEPRAPGDFGIDALLFLRAPVPEINLTTAKEALSHIDPDCSYFDWIEIASALKHQFSPHQTEEAYNLFDEWSEDGSKYGGDTETRAKWDSLRPTPVGRVPVTIRSLLRQAVAGGWDDKKVKETCFNALLRWMEDAKTMTELTEHGAKKIIATPLLSAMQEDLLVHEICKQAKKKFLYTVSATAIRKDITRLKAEVKAQEKPSEKIREPLWAKNVLYIAATQEFYRHHTGEKYRAESFNAAYSRWLLPSEDTLQAAGIPVNPATLSKPIVDPDKYALNHLKVVTVYDYAYNPSKPSDVFFVDKQRKFVNTYCPTYPELDPENAENAGGLLQFHLSNLIGEPLYRRTLIDFMAYMVQVPGRKIRWAVLIQSCEGGGKTFIAEAMKAVLGSEHVITISGDSIKSGFNEWSFGHQLVVLEEVRVAGTNRHEIMNALKPLVTNDDISITQKFRDARQAQNISNYILFSNHHDALALTPGDRRYFVVKSPLQHKAQVLALGENYFPPLYGMLRNRAGALRSWLMDWEISPDFRPDGHAPRTKYVADLINDTAGDLTAAVRRLMLEGDYPLLQFDIVSAKAILDALHIEGITRATSQQLAQVLREEGLRQAGRPMFGVERHYIWARGGISDEKAVEIAAERLAKGTKNLCMELLYA